MGNKVFVAMSGGVDSTAAALLLLEQGYDVEGVTLRLREGQGGGDIDDARTAAEALGIRHTVLDLCTLFREKVMGRFISEYVQGRTPNPCIDCNREIKFGALLDWALEQGADYIATGHYARVRQDGDTGRWALLRGLDRRKDQSYVLYQLTQRQLSHLLLPVGTYEKPRLREIAAQRGLVNAGRPDSQDICFIPDGDYAAFLERQGVALAPGDFVDEKGHVLGRHRGLERYTTGQRKGLGVSADRPLYVVRKDRETNSVVLGPEESLYTRTLTVGRVNLIALDTLPLEGLRVTAKTRYSQRESAAVLTPLSDGRARLDFDEPQRAVTAGQAAVFYDGEAVAGGGTIL